MIAIQKQIDNSILESSKRKKKRDYLGASLIGDPCERKVWYNYNIPKDIEDARVLRIFKLGQVIEDEIVVPMLKDAGFTVYEKDENGEQFGFKKDKFAGHIDGVILGVPGVTKIPHLLEIKSANNKRFNDFKKNGYRSSDTYFAQIQIYMHYLKLEAALVCVYNKDTSELYFERIKYDETYALIIADKAFRILEAKTEPERAYKRSTDFRCRFCQYKEECWK